MTIDDSSNPKDSFRFLAAFWPDLHRLGEQAERAAKTEPAFTAVRLRGFTEVMVRYLFERMGIPWTPSATQYERLVLLQSEDLLDARLLAKFHTIRKLGNHGAHNGKVAPEQAETLLDDAWSLATWFCPFVRPDVEWLIPPRRSGGGELPERLTSEDGPGLPSRQSTAVGKTGQLIRFPEERIQRIRDAVAQAMSQVDPRVRQLRTRLTIREAFGEGLTDDQKRCVEALDAFLNDPDKRVFLLKGYAGTGKTFLAKGLTEFFSSQGRTFQLAAPTGRAAKIISQKTAHPARTLHSLIYDYNELKQFSDEDQGEGFETFKVYAEVATSTGQANTVYIVDEGSLVSDVYSESDFFRSGTGYLLQDLVTYLSFQHSDNDRKLIILGDPAQLPPVGMDSSPALDAAYFQEHFGIKPAEHELKEIVRQKAESGVIRNVMPLRDNIEKGTFGGLAFVFDEDVTRIRTEEIVPLYMQAREGSGEDAPIVITHSNVEAAELNEAIRRRIFPGRDFVHAGDRLIVTANRAVEGGFLANGEFVRVVAAESAIEWRPVTVRLRNKVSRVVEAHEVTLTFRDMQLAVSLPDGSETVLDAKILDDHLHGTEAGLSTIQQRALYLDFLKRHPHLRRPEDQQALTMALRQDPYFNALRVKFGYAVTCHKAQGGEWSHAFVSCQTHHNPRTSDYFRWLYTAMTRSSNKVFLINPHEFRIQLAGPAWWSERNPLEPADATATTVTAPLADEATSPREAFRHGVLANIRALLQDTGVEIEDIAHHQYQEAVYLRRGDDAARINVIYNGKLKITGVSAARSDPFSDELAAALAQIVGKTPTAAGHQASGTWTSTPSLPTRPFLKDFHDRLLPLLASKEIQVASLKELQWSQRYTFSRRSETSVVDIFYNGKNCFTKCVPIGSNSVGAGAPRDTLLREVVEILTREIVL